MPCKPLFPTAVLYILIYKTLKRAAMLKNGERSDLSCLKAVLQKDSPWSPCSTHRALAHCSKNLRMKERNYRVSRQFIDSQIWVISLLHWNLLLSKGDGIFICLLLYCEQDMCWNLMKVLERCPLTLKIFKPGPEVVEKKRYPLLLSFPLLNMLWMWLHWSLW